MRDRTERRRAEERRAVLVNELHHTGKNTLAGGAAPPGHTPPGPPGPPPLRAPAQARVISLARAHDPLTRERWAGGAPRAGDP